MAKMIVSQEFADKFTGRLYKPGEEIEIADATRIKDLEARDLAHAAESKAPVEKTEPAKTAAVKRAKK